MLAPFDAIARLRADLFRSTMSLFLSTALLCFACDEKKAGEGEPADRRGADATLNAPDLSTVDSGGDASLATGECAGAMLRGGLVDEQGAPAEDERASKTQIHGALAYDAVGERIWVTWNEPRGEGGFQVFLRGLDCGTAGDRASVQVSADDLANRTDPAISIDGAGEQLLVAWQQDNGAPPDNLSIQLRAYGLDGAPRGEVQTLSFSDEGGAPLAGNRWMARLAPRAAGGWWLAGSWGDPSLMRFRVFVEGLDASLAPTGERYLDLGAEMASSQLEPALFTTEEGALLLAWQEESEVVIQRLDEGLTASAAQRRIEGVGARFFELSGALWVGYTRGSEARLEPLEGGPSLSLGRLGRTSLAPIGAGRQLAWYERLSGQMHSLYWRALPSPTGSLGGISQLSIERPAAPYPLDVVSAFGRVWLLWSEGENPHFSLRLAPLPLDGLE